ncbi:MAG: hypothetical protein M3209_03310 [Acidobacteriota bacterium]|nr:hypothetical protein [Acidobacteriota bacterium]
MNTQPWRVSKLLKKTFRFSITVLLSLALFVSMTTVLASPQVVFSGSNYGSIMDSPSQQPNCQVPGTPRDVIFNVTGLTGNIRTIFISLTIRHTWVGDLVATLIAPGGVRQLDLFGYTGATVGPGTNASAGDSSPLDGVYAFTDTATENWWATAAASSSSTTIPPGRYRTSQRGGSGSTGAITSLDTTFGGMTPAQANGQWILRLVDGCAADEGFISAALIEITTMSTTAASANISGRAVSATGRGLANVVIILEGGNLNEPRYAKTNPFGYYHFTDIPVGAGYTLRATSKRYVFVSPTASVNLLGDIEEANFIAEL